jgi:cell wall-associated NlpC family hydrolase
MVQTLLVRNLSVTGQVFKGYNIKRLAGMNMRRWKSALLVTALTCGLVATPVYADPTVDELQKDKAEAQSEVNSLQQELTELVSKISQLEGDLISKGQEITQAEIDLGEAQEQEEEQYDAMKLRIKFMYEEGDASVIETLFSAENFSDLVNKAEYVQNVHSYDRKMLEEYVKIKQQVRDLKTTLETELSNLESLQTEFEAQKDKLDYTIESKKSEISNLDEQLQIAVQKAAEEQRRKEEEERRRREEEERQAAERQGESTPSANRPASNPGSTNNPGTSTNPSSTPSSGGTTSGGSVSKGNTATAQAIVNAAYSQLGVPYVWGGSTPGVGLDCSGLVQYCHSVAGISLPHYSESQYAGGTKVSSPEPGDICWKPGHVGIYIGNGQMIEAQQTGTNIMISPVRAQGFVRYW